LAQRRFGDVVVVRHGGDGHLRHVVDNDWPGIVAVGVRPHLEGITPRYGVAVAVRK